MKSTLTLLTIILICFSTNAQVFVNQAATGNNDGSSWQDAFTDIQMAIDAAMDDDELWIVAGTYTPQGNTSSPDNNYFFTSKALNFYGGFDGTETELSQRDYNNNITIFSGDINGDDVADDYLNFRDDNSFHILVITNVLGTCSLDGISIQNGNAMNTEVPDNGDFSLYSGAGLYISSASTILRNCTIKQCSGNYGAALYAWGNGGENSLTVEHCNFQDNNSLRGCFTAFSMLDLNISTSLFEGNFSAIYGGGITFGNTNATVSNTVFQDNETPSSSIGGAILIYQNSWNLINNPIININHCDFNDNIAGAGAGICFNNFFPNSTINIDSCYFAENISNFASNNGGAAITIQNFPDNFGGGLSTISANLSNSILEDNESYAGGALYFNCNQTTSDLQITNTEFIDNFSATIGGALVLNSISSTLTTDITNSTFSNNTATTGSVLSATALTNTRLTNILAFQNNGSASFSNSGYMSLLNCTLMENSSGVMNTSTGEMDIQNSIFSSIGQNSLGGNNSITSFGGNLSSDPSLEDAFIGFDIYADFNDISPSLDMNFVPESNSICVDAGNPTNIVATTDLAGEDRIQGSQIDIGAFESGFEVGLSSLNNKRINIYPNPFISELHLSDISDIENIRLLDASGKPVAEFAPSKQLVIGEILPEGIYFLELNYADFQSIEKLQRINKN